MKKFIFCIFLVFPFALTQAQETDLVIKNIASGRMPNMDTDKSNQLHIVYGSGDSILYIFSKNGRVFSEPQLVAVLPQLFASAMRGPQVAATNKFVVITACNKGGDIFSFNKSGSDKWSTGVRVNNKRETAKEALMSLSADNSLTYATWLSVNGPKGQVLMGARSLDGGKVWQKNSVVYTSPDGSICECCKPSVVVKDRRIYAMFRNWLNGSRDLYFIQSSNGGNSFGQAEKLGQGTWKLNGCPMDGGGIAINSKNIPQTVWRREGKIFAYSPNMLEKELGEGKASTIASVNNKNVYAWIENGNIVFINAGGQKQIIGKGTQPVLKVLNNKEVFCLYESDKSVKGTILKI